MWFSTCQRLTHFYESLTCSSANSSPPPLHLAADQFLYSTSRPPGRSRPHRTFLLRRGRRRWPLGPSSSTQLAPGRLTRRARWLKLLHNSVGGGNTQKRKQERISSEQPASLKWLTTGVNQSHLGFQYSYCRCCKHATGRNLRPTPFFLAMQTIRESKGQKKRLNEMTSRLYCFF